MKMRYTQGGGNPDYSAPVIETLEVSIEKGFADSTFFGEEGEPGGGLGDNNFGEF